MGAATMAPAKAESKPMSDTQALEKASPKTPAIITTPEEYRGALLRWQEQHFTVLTPFVQISGMAPSHGIVSTLIQVNANKDVGEVYDNSGGLPFLKQGELALAKNGLRKIAEGLGISTRLEYISVGVIPHYWHVKAIATYKGLDGATVTREASVEWDLKDGSVRAREFGDRQIGQARKHGLRNCETRAINAAIRECGCGIKQKYSREELARPFLAIRVAFQPDMDDPETRRLITERALAGTGALYPAPASTVVPPADAFHEDAPATAPRLVGSGASAAASAESAPATKADEPKLPDGFGFIQKVERETKKKRDNSGSFIKFHVIDHAGVEHVTVRGNVGEALERCWKENVAVDIDSHENDYQELEIDEFHKVDPKQPTLPDVDKL